MRLPFVGTVRVRRRRVMAPGGTVVVFVMSVLAMLYVDRAGRRFGWGFGDVGPVMGATSE